MDRRTARSTTTAALALMATVTVAGCSWLGGSGDSEPAQPTAEQRRAACDRLAAQAIDAELVTDARSLAARATECYAAEVERGDAE